VKDAMLLGAARGTRRDGRPFNIEKAERRLFRKEQHLLEVHLNANPLRSSKDLEQAFKDKDRRLYPSFYDDSTLLEEVIRAQQAQEPTMVELQTEVEMGLGPVDTDIAVRVQERRKTPTETSATDPRLQRDGQDYFAWGDRIKPPVTISIRDCVYETDRQRWDRLAYARNLGVPREQVKDPAKSWHLIRHRDGTLRAGTKEEMEYLTQKPTETPVLVEYARQQEVKDLLERQTLLDAPMDPKVKGKLGQLRHRMRDKVERELRANFRAKATSTLQTRLTKYQRR
jgi:hypothetical protein